MIRLSGCGARQGQRTSAAGAVFTVCGGQRLPKTKKIEHAARHGPPLGLCLLCWREEWKIRKASLSLAAALQSQPPWRKRPPIWERSSFPGGTPAEARKYGRSVPVLASEEIEGRGITTVQDALRSVPGLMLNGSGNSFTRSASAVPKQIAR
ncbi:hypothetical protein ACFMBG_09625 [Leisingera sp. D0M16]|uniref:hypothetical protein n=1 Tax=Leisingera coralii TaxID=3351347 RepID=UPI003B81CC2F